ncbi:MAG: hypothetical protein JW993_18825 [Sedimentisphaerales bacterium]|nr:hypothetical protein [Sedimentisphaerales bacterium]
MQSRITKLAAVAVVVIAALVAIHFLGNPLSSTVSFASVIEPILNANTAVLDIVIGEEKEGTPVIHDMVMGSRIRRSLSTMGDATSIIDLESSRILVLSQKDKKAQFVSMEGLPPIPNYLDHLKNILVKLQESPDFAFEELGEREVDGRTLLGFHIKHPRVDLTLWADPATGLPVRIEQNEGQMRVICKNMRFDVPMEEALFSMDVPEGYTLQEETTLDLQAGTEEAFLKGLRLLAETFNEGRFPDGVAVEDYLKLAPAVAQQIESMNLSDEEETALGVKIQNMLLFTRFFQGEGKWYYRGQGVTLGEADKAIFWYRPKGSATYRVIYGDLHVEDVARENLPEPLDADDVLGRSGGYEQGSDPNFLGTQEDNWTVDASGKITVEAQIILARGPEGDANVPVTLSYPSGVLTSVAQGDVNVPFVHTADGKYEVQLSRDKLLAGQRKFVCRWQFSLGELPEKQHDDLSYYEVALKSLLPVTSYSLTAHLAPDSGFEFSIAPSQTYLTLFSIGRGDGKTQFGTCGLPIRKRN